MFSFFKKKPPAADPESAAAVAPTEPIEGPKTAAAPPTRSTPERPDAIREAAVQVAAPRAAASKPAELQPAPAFGAAFAAPRAPEDDRRDWLAKLRNGLRKTGSSLTQVLVAVRIDESLYDDLEAVLLQADVGADATTFLLDDLKRRVKLAGVGDAATARPLLVAALADLLAPLERPLQVGFETPTVMMVVGVNGAGKTTSVGKLARYLAEAGQKVLLAAADTFRAAARDQLAEWAERAGRADGSGVSLKSRIEIVSQAGGDPAGVVFDAVVAGKARACDVVIADTAGRLTTQAHLMDELKKIRRTIGKAQAGAPHEVLLVIDGNTGQNALSQVRIFDEALGLTGLVITKLDGSAKGGVLAAIALWSRSRATPLPVYFVGVGERLEDLQTFRAREFAGALFG